MILEKTSPRLTDNRKTMSLNRVSNSIRCRLPMKMDRCINYVCVIFSGFFAKQTSQPSLQTMWWVGEYYGPVLLVCFFIFLKRVHDFLSGQTNVLKNRQADNDVEPVMPAATDRNEAAEAEQVEVRVRLKNLVLVFQNVFFCWYWSVWHLIHIQTKEQLAKCTKEKDELEQRCKRLMNSVSAAACATEVWMQYSCMFVQIKINEIKRCIIRKTLSFLYSKKKSNLDVLNTNCRCFVRREILLFKGCVFNDWFFLVPTCCAQEGFLNKRMSLFFQYSVKRRVQTRWQKYAKKQN